MKTQDVPIKIIDNRYKLLCIMTLTFAFFLLSVRYVKADNMSNENFIIEGNFNTTSGKSISKKYKATTTVGETGPGLYTGTNFKVKAGFEYIYPATAAFSFSLSESLIDFGVLSATNPVTRTTTLSVMNPSGGYNLVGYENHPLLAPNGSRINDTTCDNGSCSEITSAEWTNTLTYGFGYRCDNILGNDCDSGFASTNYYKQFADLSKKENPQTIMTGTVPGQKREGKITYKVNISGTQQPGIYINTITYIAAPGF